MIGDFRSMEWVLESGKSLERGTYAVMLFVVQVRGLARQQTHYIDKVVVDLSQMQPAIVVLPMSNLVNHVAGTNDIGSADVFRIIDETSQRVEHGSSI